MTNYEKCRHCWHFIEANVVQADAYFDIAAYVHLDNGSKEHDHDAEPSGDIRTLDEWKRDYPELFYQHKDGEIGPNSVHFNADHVTAWTAADEGCDTCWYFITDHALTELGAAALAAKLRKHLESGHMLTSEEC